MSTPSKGRSTVVRARSAKRLGLLGAVLLLAGYALPYRGDFNGVYVSLLLGPIGGPFRPSIQRLIFTPLEGLGTVALVLFVALAKADESRRMLGAGVLMGVGVVESLSFLQLLGNGIVANLAIWIAFIGAVVVLTAGLVTWTSRADSETDQPRDRPGKL